MNETHPATNPEFLFHQMRLRRSRTWQRRRGSMLLLVAGIVLVFPVLLIIAPPGGGKLNALFPILLFASLSLALFYRGWLALKQGRRPINDEEVALRRREDRQQLFYFAQGHRPWRYWITTAFEGLVGLFFLFIGSQPVWRLTQSLSDEDLVFLAVGIPFLLAGGYYLFKALKSIRLLRRLTELSSQELAARLSLGEGTEGE